LAENLVRHTRHRGEVKREVVTEPGKRCNHGRMSHKMCCSAGRSSGLCSMLIKRRTAIDRNRPQTGRSTHSYFESEA
jgi:hypothetical protein